MIKPTKTQSELNSCISQLGRREKKSEVMISALTKEALAHLLEHGQIQPINSLLAALSPANQKAVKSLISECTIYAWRDDLKQFGGKNKKGNQGEKDINLRRFISVYQGDLWSWYKAKKILEPNPHKYKGESLLTVFKRFVDEHGSDFDRLDMDIKTYREEALKYSIQKPLIEKKISELISIGFSVEDAKKFAHKLAKEGKLE